MATTPKLEIIDTSEDSTDQKGSKSPNYKVIIKVFENKWDEIQAKKERDQEKPAKKETKKWVNSTTTTTKGKTEAGL
mgnify:CR=1 FL=1